MRITDKRYSSLRHKKNMIFGHTNEMFVPSHRLVGVGIGSVDCEVAGSGLDARRTESSSDDTSPVPDKVNRVLSIVFLRLASLTRLRGDDDCGVTSTTSPPQAGKAAFQVVVYIEAPLWPLSQYPFTSEQSFVADAVSTDRFTDRKGARCTLTSTPSSSGRKSPVPGPALGDSAPVCTAAFMFSRRWSSQSMTCISIAASVGKFNTEAATRPGVAGVRNGHGTRL